MKGIIISDDCIIYNDMSRGWVAGKGQPLWHKKVYHMWRSMWRRVYSELNWFGCLIYPNFKYLSNYVKWIESQPRFEEFCSTCHNTRWNIDKDKMDNRNYYPAFMSLCLDWENSRERIFRKGNPMTLKAVIGIPLTDNNIIIFDFISQARHKGFHTGEICQVCQGKHKSHKGYKWHYLNIIKL